MLNSMVASEFYLWRRRLWMGLMALLNHTGRIVEALKVSMLAVRRCKLLRCSELVTLHSYVRYQCFSLPYIFLFSRCKVTV